MKKHLSDGFTCLNLLSGSVGIVLAFESKLTYACYAIFLASVFDLFDGFLARLTGSSSEFGKQLDSLADIISFGLLPAIIIYQLFMQSQVMEIYRPFLKFTPFFMTICSAIRLANFNIDQGQSENFLGLPTPANALLVGSLPFLMEEKPELAKLILNPFFLSFFCLGMGLLLIAKIPMISLKFNGYQINQNLPRYIFLLSSLLFIGFFKFCALPIILLLYMLISFIKFSHIHEVSRKHTGHAPE